MTFMANSTPPNQPDELLQVLEQLDLQANKTFFAESEIGRPILRNGIVRGDSNCKISSASILADAVSGVFGDGANAEPDKGYSNDRYCVWIIKGVDCESATYPCQSLVEVQFDKLRVWSGDFVRVYSHPNRNCAFDGGQQLVAQFSGIHDEKKPLPSPVRAKGCLSVIFQTGTPTNPTKSFTLKRLTFPYSSCCTFRW